MSKAPQGGWEWVKSETNSVQIGYNEDYAFIQGAGAVIAFPLDDLSRLIAALQDVDRHMREAA